MFTNNYSCCPKIQKVRVSKKTTASSQLKMKLFGFLWSCLCARCSVPVYRISHNDESKQGLECNRNPNRERRENGGRVLPESQFERLCEADLFATRSHFFASLSQSNKLHDTTVLYTRRCLVFINSTAPRTAHRPPTTHR